MSIYVLRYKDLFKIGYTASLSSRIRSIMSTIPGKVEFVGYMPGDEAVEQHLHLVFQESRFSGEWFADSPALSFFCERFLDHQQPEVVDRRTTSPARKDYPPEVLEIRAIAQKVWPETDHKARIKHLSLALGWPKPRAKKLYYAEVDVKASELAEVRQLAVARTPTETTGED